jgi:hypothetical protein
LDLEISNQERDNSLGRRNRKFTLAERAKSENRYALHIDIPWSQQTSQQRKIADKLPSIFEGINRRVADLTIQLSIPAEKTLTTIRLFDRPGDFFDGDLAEHLVKWGDTHASDVRAIVSGFDIEDNRKLDNVEPSHLVQVVIANDRLGWHEGGSMAHSIVRTTEKLWPTLIEDIFLDICMFQSFPDRKQKQTIEREKKNHLFAQKKVDYVKSLNRDSTYGPIIGNPRYLAISSFYRYGQQLDIEPYVQSWTTFLTSLDSRPEVKSRGAAASIHNSLIIRSLTSADELVATGQIAGESANELSKSKIVTDIVQRHLKGPQINARKLGKLIEGLPKGSYFLIRTETKPRLQKAEISLSSLFGPGIWKTGKMRIMPIGDLPKYKAYDPYISIFRFEVP